MIAWLQGILREKTPGQVIVDVHGVGYRVMVSLHTFYELPALGEEVALYTQLVVREDALHLYGFSQAQEKEAFARLVSISGVGPKLALSLLSGIATAELWQAVRNRDTERLSKVPGVGKKTATRLVVELEGKLPQGEEGGSVHSPLEADALSALLNLGYSEAQGRRALQEAARILAGREPNLQEILTAALKYAGGGL